MNSIMVVVTDTNGNVFSKEWDGSVSKLKAIKWTIENDNLEMYITGDVVSIKVVEME